MYALIVVFEKRNVTIRRFYDEKKRLVLLAAVVSLHGAAFAEDDNNNETSSTEAVSQERDQERQGPEGNAASAGQSECR